MIVAVNELAAQQAAPTSTTINKCNMLLDYAHTYPDATIRYYASGMCLHIDSDSAYLVHPRARSRIADHHYLSDRIPQHVNKPDSKPNGPILTECRTIWNIMSSVAEAETIGIYHNSRAAVPIRTALATV